MQLCNCEREILMIVTLRARLTKLYLYFIILYSFVNFKV